MVFPWKKAHNEKIFINYRRDDAGGFAGRLSDTLAAQPQVRTFLSRHQGAVLSVAFSPDGQTLVSASFDKTVILWDVIRALSDYELLVRKACAIANRNLRHEEWAQYAGADVPYQEPCPELPVPKD